MKKKNLLTLTALCLSLGLTVTACQGPSGTAGEKGETGPKGETGAKGEKGDTYLAIIVKDWKNKGGEIKQDKYFIEPGETFTLTFEPEEGNDIVLKFVVNGEEIALADGATSWSPSKEETLKATGYQVYAEFTNARSYLETELLEFYNDLVKNDNQLQGVGKNAAETAYEAKALKVGASNYANDSTATDVVDEAVDQLNDLDTFDDKLSANATTAEKLAAAKEYLKNAEEKINSKYDAYVKFAKEEAIKTFEANLETVKATAGTVTTGTGTSAKTSDVYDSSNDKANGEKAINACKTVEAVAKLANDLIANVDSDSGSLDKWLELKDKAYSTISTDYNALVGTSAKEGELGPTNVEKLKDLGITDCDPTDIYNKYNAKVQAAGVDGIKAVSDANSTGSDIGDAAHEEFEGLEAKAIKEVVAAIRQKWLDLIDEFAKSKYEPQSSTIDGLKIGLNNVVDNYAADKSVKVSTVLSDNSGLDSEISKVVFTGNANNTVLANTNFRSFCKEKSFEDALETLEEAYKSAEAGYNDEIYQKAIACAKGTKDTTKYKAKYATLGKVTADNDVNNPIFGIADSNGESDYVASSVDGIADKDSFTESSATSTATTYSTKQWYDTLIAMVNDSTVDSWDSTKINTWAKVHKGDFKKIYEKATEILVGTKADQNKTLYGLVNLSSLNSLKFISTNSLDNAIKGDTWAELIASAQSTAANKNSLVNLDKALYEFVTGVDYSDGATALTSPSEASGDDKWQTYIGWDSGAKTFTANENSAFGKAVAEKITAVLAGQSVASVTGDLSSLYRKDIENYYNSVLSTLVDLKNTDNGKVVGDAVKSDKITAIWEKLQFGSSDTITVYSSAALTFDASGNLASVSISKTKTATEAIEIKISKKSMGDITVSSKTTYGIDSWASLLSAQMNEIAK